MNGFSYNGVHCEDMGVTYIPDASAQWFVSPDIETAKDNVAWRDGSYYFYTRRKARTFSLKCYFENVNIYGREKIRRWLDEKTSGWLVFDDRDYIRYNVHPSKVVSGKIYRQSEACMAEDYYNGTFTVTFDADEPYGILTKLVDDNLIQGQTENVCNLIRSNMMPVMPSASNVITSGAKVFNQGTVECGCTINIGGSAPNGLEIYNSTNETRCVLRGLPSSGYLQINSDTGLIQLITSQGTEHGFTYHDYGYIRLAPNDMPEFAVMVDHTANSSDITFPRIPQNVVEKFLYIDGVWRQVTSYTTTTSGRVYHMNSAASTTNTEMVPIGVMNEISVSASGASLTQFELTYTPRAL